MSSKVFDKKLRTVEKRNRHIQNTIDNEKIRNEFLGDIKSQCLGQDAKSGHYLETIANYLLESPDIESGRKIRDTFYPSEKYYWSKSSVAKNLQVSSERLENIPDDSNKQPNLDTLRNLFKIDNIDQSVIRNVILLGFMNPEIRIKVSEIDDSLLDALDWLCSEIGQSMTAQDKKLIIMFDGQETVSSIANKLGVSHQNISKKIKKICKNAEKWLRIEN